MDKHEETTLRFLSGQLGADENASAGAHIASCRNCAKLFKADLKAEDWFARMRTAEPPAWLEARALAAVRPAQLSLSGWLRVLIPAGAVSAAALGAWLLLATGERGNMHPVDDMVFNKTDSVTASAVSDDDDREPVSFLRLSEEDDV